MRLSSTFEKLAQRFALDFAELAGETTHPGESGGSREEALRRLLTDYLPHRAAIGTGFVIDATGRTSKQIDIVIHDATVGVQFDVGYVTYYPCETVIAVGEVKSEVTTTARLREALDNIKSVKELDRSNKGTNQPITGPGYSIPTARGFDPVRNNRDQILGFIFTGQSLTKASLMRALQAWQSEHPRIVWPNIYCDHNEFLISYESSEYLTTSAMEAVNMYCTAPEERNNLLVLFVSLLAGFVNEAHVARPQYNAYASIASTMHEDFPLGQ